ncbi:MAG: cupin domain-containing protein [Candidatus Lokiarchaeota archaeon]|nr:cupin domain-containing protein [Candidatus Lokiarchaeota archaeon]MBD3201839.1 cupin domain-containing protein [Candidatus Lokiarchaeota archaeon]
MDIENIESKKIKFNLDTGFSPNQCSKKRMLSDMEGMYNNIKEYRNILQKGDKIVYEFHDLDINQRSAELCYGTTVVYPGKVGDEYYMTKGHFHEVLDTAEVYYSLKGQGILLMENIDGRIEIQEMEPGDSVYVPPGFAHRSINISKNEPFITFFVYRADAGHDYKTIENKGFRKLVIERNGTPTIIDNPNWNNK